MVRMKLDKQSIEGIASLAAAVAREQYRNQKYDGLVRLADVPDFEETPAWSALIKAVSTLDQDQRAELIAVMWVGRHDHTVTSDELAGHIASAREIDVFDYLVYNPCLATYLRNGLQHVVEFL